MRAKEWHKEYTAGGFRCSHCKRWVGINDYIGTANRNHCNLCLWSKHVDETKGDRRSTCESGMKPIGLTFKQEGFGKQGEIMLIHACAGCNKISINRVARDDGNDEILACFESSMLLEPIIRQNIQGLRIVLLDEGDRNDVLIQLFGK